MSHKIEVSEVDKKHEFNHMFAMSTKENKSLDFVGVLDIESDSTQSFYRVKVNETVILETSSFTKAVEKYNSI